MRNTFWSNSSAEPLLPTLARRASEGFNALPRSRFGLLFATLAALVITATAASADPSLQPAASSPQPPLDTLVVCPAEFRDALAPWLAYRQAQGHRIGLLSNQPDFEQLQAAIRREAKSGQLKCVLLVGDADPESKDDAKVRARSVPTTYAASKLIARFGGERTIATDAPYGDLDGDGAAELAVGRLPVDTPQQLANLVARIIAYEKSQDFGLWRRRINLVAGAGDFGPLVDPLIENTAREFLSSGVPAAYQTTMTYGNWRSPFCPDPRLFGQTALARINQGCLFWVYMGHSQVCELQPLTVPGAQYPLLPPEDVRQVASGAGSPIALLFCCYAGAFDARMDCLGETLLCQPAGPVAVFAGSRMTMPYGMATLASEMLDGCFEKHCQTLGELAARARSESLRNGEASPRRQWLDRMASFASPSRNELPSERQDHALLFNLLGDPLMRIRQPQPVALTVPPRATVGDRLEIVGRSPVAGRCVLELVVRRDRLTFTPPVRIDYDDQEAALAAFTQVYNKANDPRVLTQQINVPVGEFRATFDLPAEAAGACHVRAYVIGAEDFAAGAADVKVMAPPPPVPSAPAPPARTAETGGKASQS